MSSFLHDLRLALRRLLHQRTFTITAMATLALATAPCIVAFSLLRAVALQPLPFAEPERLVRVSELHPETGRFPTSDPNFADWREQQTSFTHLTAYRQDREVLTRADRGEQISMTRTTPELFELLGSVVPLHGRALQASDSEDEPVVVLSHALGRRLGDAASLVGERLEIGGKSHQVVGVLPADFDFPPGSDLWIPWTPDANGDRSDHWLTAVARLKPEISQRQAQLEMDRIAATLAAEYPSSNQGWGAEVQPMVSWLVPASVRRAMLLLQGSVILVFLLASANLINLLAARASARQREMALRACLGADRGRLVRESLTEALALAVPGALGGLWLAFWLLPVVLRLAPTNIPRLEQAAIDGSVGWFTLALTIAAVLFLGGAPGAAAQSDPILGLRGGRSTSALAPRFRRSLVTVQIGLGMAVLVLAGLMFTSLNRLSTTHPGFTTHQTWSGEINLSASEDATAALQRVQERLTAVPGVREVGATSTPPLGGMYAFENDVTPLDRVADVPMGGFMQTSWRITSPGFFTSLSIPLLEGRLFDDRDGADDGPKRAVVSQSFTSRMWPDETTFQGRQFFFGGTDGTPWTIIGVVGDIRDVRLDAPPPSSMYLPHRAAPFPSMALTVQSHTAHLPIEALAAALREVDPRIPKVEFQPFAELERDATARQRFHTRLITVLAILAMILAAGGVYGLMAFEAEQLQHATGIRMALGAEASDVSRAFLFEGIRRVLLGATAGSLLALASAPLVAELLYDTSMFEPGAYGAAAALLVITALLAAWLPSRSLARVEPRDLLVAQ